jgi:hypothetical protein
MGWGESRHDLGSNNSNDDEDDKRFWELYRMNPFVHPGTGGRIDEQYWSDLFSSFIIEYRQAIELQLLHPRYSHLFGPAQRCNRELIKGMLCRMEPAYTAALLRTHQVIYVDDAGAIGECMSNELRLVDYWPQFLADFPPRARMWEIWREAMESGQRPPP